MRRDKHVRDNHPNPQIRHHLLFQSHHQKVQGRLKDSGSSGNARMLLEASQSSSNNSNPTVAETETDNDTDNAPERGKPEREIQKISLLVSGVGGRGRQPLNPARGVEPRLAVAPTQRGFRSASQTSAMQKRIASPKPSTPKTRGFLLFFTM